LHAFDYKFPLHLNWLPHLDAQALAQQLESFVLPNPPDSSSIPHWRLWPRGFGKSWSWPPA